MKILKQKLSRGSVLVFTLLITGLMLATAISLIAASSIERKTSGVSSKSTQSFQVADSGAEIVLQKIYKESSAASFISDLGTCDPATKMVSGLLSTGKEYKVTFYDDADVQLACTGLVSVVRKIKSVGTYASTSRAVEVAVAVVWNGVWAFRSDACSSWSCTATASCPGELVIQGFVGDSNSRDAILLSGINNSYYGNCTPLNPLGEKSYSCTTGTGSSSVGGASVAIICS